MTPYQFVVLRYVGDVAAGEFVNVGIALWSPRGPSLHTRFNERYGRVSRFFSDFDGNAYRTVIKHIEDQFDERSIALGQTELLEPPPKGLVEATRSVIPEDDSAFQWSSLMAGIADDPVQRLDELFEELVVRHERQFLRERRDEQAMKRDVDAFLRNAGLMDRLNRHVEVVGEDYEYSFYRGWRNGTLQVLEPISLDYVNAAEMIDRANTWSGRLYNLSRRSTFGFTGIIGVPTEAEHDDSLNRAVSILKKAPNVRRIVLESHIEEVVEDIERDLSGQHG